MAQMKTSLHNPILFPQQDSDWENLATFNGSVVQVGQDIQMVYRALTTRKNKKGQEYQSSSIGAAHSEDGFHFSQRHQLIAPEMPWEQYGCEDPRITYIDGKYYIFYTALAASPPQPEHIRVAVAVSSDLQTIEERHLVTPFNAKAMALFPEKINGQYVVVLTVNTDQPPAQIAIARFDRIEQMWEESYWQDWYSHLEDHSLPLYRLSNDQVEVGAVPIATEDGWLVLYCHIQNYYTPAQRIFGVEAVLLDRYNPNQVIARTDGPLLVPQEEYDLKGMVPNVIFPSGGLVQGGELLIYYGAADTTVAVAACNLQELLQEMRQTPLGYVYTLERFSWNPILRPIAVDDWRSQAVFNPAAFEHHRKVYVLYRAFSADKTSTIGCAVSDNGYTFSDFSPDPIFVPRYDFELKQKPDSFSGCEDPRVSIIGDHLYLFYTAYNGVDAPRVAMSEILVSDFIAGRWNWSPSKLISLPGVDNKDACLLPEKINNRYVIFHRSGGKHIMMDWIDDLEFESNEWLEEEECIEARPNSWDSAKIGVAGPPLRTEQGWLLFYHGVSLVDQHYRLGALLLDLKNPMNVLARSKYPLLSPQREYETTGLVKNVVFPCGAVSCGTCLFLYYGAGDTVIGGAVGQVKDILRSLEPTAR